MEELRQKILNPGPGKISYNLLKEDAKNAQSTYNWPDKDLYKKLFVAITWESQN